MKNQTRFPKYFLLTLAALYLLTFAPFWKPILLGYICALASLPITRFFQTRFQVSARLFRRFVLAGATLGIFLLLFALSAKTTELIQNVLENPQEYVQIYNRILEVPNKVFAILAERGWSISEPQRGFISRQIAETSQALGALAKGFLSTLLTSAPAWLLTLFVFCLSYVGFISNHPIFHRWLIQRTGRQIPARRLIRQIKIASTDVLGTTLVIALFQAVVTATVAAALRDFPFFPVLIGTFVIALIPFGGGGFVNCLFALESAVNGTSGQALVFVATAIFVGTFDNLLRAWLSSRQSNTNALFSLMSILGAISVFGFIGIIFGPMIENIALAFLSQREPQSLPQRSTQASTHPPGRRTTREAQASPAAPPLRQISR